MVERMSRGRVGEAITDAAVEILEVSKEPVWMEFHDMPNTHFATDGVLRSKK